MNPTYPFRALLYHVPCVKNKVSNFFLDARPFPAPCQCNPFAVNRRVYYYYVRAVIRRPRAGRPRSDRAGAAQGLYRLRECRPRGTLPRDDPGGVLEESWRSNYY